MVISFFARFFFFISFYVLFCVSIFSDRFFSLLIEVFGAWTVCTIRLNGQYTQTSKEKTHLIWRLNRKMSVSSNFSVIDELVFFCFLFLLVFSVWKRFSFNRRRKTKLNVSIEMYCWKQHWFELIGAGNESFI